MNTPKLLPLVLTLVTIACIDITVVNDGGEETTAFTGATDEDTSTETGGVCEAIPVPDCDSEGRCWITEPGWTADAQVIDWAEIEDGVLAGTLVPIPDSDPQCWTYAELASTCVLERDCYLLVGRPQGELTLTTGGCTATGPWESTATDELGACWGIFSEGIAVRLRGH